MDVSQQQENEFYTLRNEAAALLSKEPLKNNPNVTYGQLLSPKELEFAAHMYSPEIKTRASQIYSPEDIARIETAVDWETRVKPYDRAPIEYDMNERHPDYMRRLDEYNTSPANRMRQSGDVADINEARYGLIEGDIAPIPPTLPFGLAESQEIAARGFDPSPDNQLRFENPGDSLKFNNSVAFGPRKMTIKNYKFIGDKFGLKGDYVYINPSKPSLGVAFRPEGEENFQIINSPSVTAEDTLRILTQEAPAIAGDIGLTVYGASRFTSPAGLAGGMVGKGLKVLGLSGAAAIGATTGDFLRLLAGKQIGAHDLDMVEMLQEAGVIGAWAFAGTAGITLSSRAIIKAYKMVTGKDVPPGVFEQIDNALQASRQTDAAGPGLVYGDAVSVKQIKDQIQDLTDRYAADFGKGYNPTMPSQAGTRSAADLETVFLKYADDTDLREAYAAIKDGNQEVIDEFVRVLNEKIGPSTAGVDDALGSTVSESLRVLAQKDIDMFTDQTYDMINQVRRQVGGADDAAVAGEVLLKQVDNPESSSGPIFERTQTRLKELRKKYVKPFNEAWTNALNNPRYTNLKTGAGYTRAAAQKWLDGRKAQAGQLFREAQGDEAVRELYNLIPAGSRETINRLRGIGSKGFKSPDFTIDELNTARVALNDFASNLPDGKKGIEKLARGLERGLEDQMNVLVKQGASLESGIPVTQKVKLNKWINENEYGDDLRKAWSGQKEALELSNSQAILSLLEQKRPEKVAEYIFNTVAKGSNKNKPITDLITFLKKDGSDEVLQIQEGLAAYIQKEILDPSKGKPFQRATKYRDFINENQGTLKAVFGEKNFNKRFGNPIKFEKVIQQIEKTNEDILRIQARFGDVSTKNASIFSILFDPDKKISNIVESILATGKTQKQSGRILEDIEYLASITKNNPELAEQVAQVTKRFLLQDVITPRQGGGYNLDAAGLNKLLKEGFGPEEVVGPRLTFDSFITPLLGKKQGKEFIKNLTILDNMVQREVGVEASEGIQKVINSGDYVVGNNIEGARMLQRLLIAPLTQTGRRVTAISTRQADNSRKFIGKMLLDPALFERTMDFAKGIESTQKFISFLTAYNMVAARDLGNEMKFYDTTDKAQKTPDYSITRTPIQLYNDSKFRKFFNLPERLLDLEETP